MRQHSLLPMSMCLLLLDRVPDARLAPTQDSAPYRRSTKDMERFSLPPCRTLHQAPRTAISSCPPAYRPRRRQTGLDQRYAAAVRSYCARPFQRAGGPEQPCSHAHASPLGSEKSHTLNCHCPESYSGSGRAGRSTRGDGPHNYNGGGAELGGVATGGASEADNSASTGRGGEAGAVVCN